MSRLIDLMYRLFNIMLDSNWLIFSPMGGQEYIDISGYYVVKSRFIFKLNKRLNKFYFYSAKYWKGKI